MVTKAIYESLKSHYNKLFHENFGQYWGFNKNDIETYDMCYLLFDTLRLSTERGAL